MKNKNMVKVLFVCLGNICRSPMAEAVFVDMVSRKGLESAFKIESCGTTAYHAGEDADPRTLETLREKGLEMQHCARAFRIEDFYHFDYIIAMDTKNYEDILNEKPEKAAAETFLFREFDTDKEDPDVPDPYWSGADGFNEVYDIISRSCENLLYYIVQKHTLKTP